MKLIITKKSDRRNRKEFEITGIEFHPENMTIVFVEEGKENSIQTINAKTNFNYFIRR